MHRYILQKLSKQPEQTPLQGIRVEAISASSESKSGITSFSSKLSGIFSPPTMNQ